jgi:hypothetical protein
MDALDLGPFTEVFVNSSEQGKYKAWSIGRELPSNRPKTANFFGSCVQILAGNPALTRWILCNEQEDNSVRLEDFSRERSYQQNAIHFFLDNPLLFKPQILVSSFLIPIPFLTL